MVEAIFAKLAEITQDILESQFLPQALKWLVIGGIFLFTELIHRAWMIIWFVAGATSAALVALFFPSAILAQVAVFFGVTGVSLGVFVYIRTSHAPDLKAPPVIPQGRKVRVVEEINGAGGGLVSIDGVTYKAQFENSEQPAKSGEWVMTAGFDPDELVVMVRRAESLRRR